MDRCGEVESIACSPDGVWLAVGVSSVGSANPYNGLRLINPATGEDRQIRSCYWYPGECDWFDIDWSPDGKCIVFQRGPSVDGPWTLWIAQADGSGARRLGPAHGRCVDESSPTFSPDGKDIAFECHNHTGHGELFSIVLVDRDDGARHVVIRGTSAAGVGRPQFAPDGKRRTDRFLPTASRSSSRQARARRRRVGRTSRTSSPCMSTAPGSRPSPA